MKANHFYIKVVVFVLLMVLAVSVLIYLAQPKPCDYLLTELAVQNKIDSGVAPMEAYQQALWQHKECTCLGFKEKNQTSFAKSTKCYGIVTDTRQTKQVK